MVTRNGEPVAELRPIRPTRRPFVPRSDLASMPGAGDRIDHRQFRADAERAVDQRL